MGAGKSTLGALLARMIGAIHIDTDSHIEILTKKSIREIFKSEGESKFRQYENLFLQNCNLPINSVISCGGGLPNSGKTMQLMKTMGKVIYLEVPLGVVFSRLRLDQSRPLFDTFRQHDGINKLFNQRLCIYNQADIRIDASQSPCHIADEIFHIIE